MAKWLKHDLKMDPDHGWRSRPGYQIFVADRGAVIFEFPQDWVVEPALDAIKLYDRQPPDDECRLQVSVFRFPGVAVDWDELPLAKLLEDAMAGSEPNERSRGKIVQERRPGVELVWRETRFVDEAQARPARSRSCLARGNNVHALLTLDFWEVDARRLVPVWNAILDSLQLGKYIRDPRKGPARLDA